MVCNVKRIINGVSEVFDIEKFIEVIKEKLQRTYTNGFHGGIQTRLLPFG